MSKHVAFDSVARVIAAARREAEELRAELVTLAAKAVEERALLAAEIADLRAKLMRAAVDAAELESARKSAALLGGAMSALRAIAGHGDVWSAKQAGEALHAAQ